jgi:NADH dehydrogenase [ubiquinone] 1 alpha subcomplex assembly factor 1
MAKDRIRTIGISLLGGNSGAEGEYDLAVKNIRMFDQRDVLEKDRPRA